MPVSSRFDDNDAAALSLCYWIVFSILSLNSTALIPKFKTPHPLCLSQESSKPAREAKAKAKFKMKAKAKPKARADEASCCA